MPRRRKKVSFNTRTPRSWLALIGLVVLFIAPHILAQGSDKARFLPARSNVVQEDISQGRRGRVIRVSDGDTLKLDTGERVRLIGVDCPETQANAKARRDSERTGQDLETIIKMGKESKGFMERLLLGRDVVLEFDVQRYDKYGRVLAYVYVDLRDLQMFEEYRTRGSQGLISLNEELARQGYAQPMTIPPNVKYASRFEELSREAIQQKRGLWR